MTIYQTARTLFVVAFDCYDTAVERGDTAQAEKGKAALVQSYNDMTESCEKLMAHIDKLEGRV
jgi:hypothetical protein